MKTPTTLPARALLLAALTATTVLAQTGSGADKRVINIQGASTGNLRTGPLNFTGSPVKATVSTLLIQAAQATLAAPAGTPIIEARGKRTANFSGNINVTRGRLSAKGDKLAYSEVSGQGVLSGGAAATFQPDGSSGNDPVNITATQMSLDVDNNVSTSTGGVRLTNGTQTGRADKLVFDEDKELAQLTGTPSLTRAAKGNQKELVISGTEVRALTKSKTLYVRGGVKLVQGSQTTTGDAVYYDDAKNVAYVVGNAVSVDSKSKVTLRAPASGYLEQRTDLARVTPKNSRYTIPVAQFALRGEQ
ncbi:LptA/OstA family protein [uncultured Deinococcus sp.]|uniref:LptA/OstA family protein n=1 Tax=uncultured Deinococcus sp. TaxID=158789 RepID=UPI002590A5CC|nr:LptA/OstA family protein [uncultured Deinococcus sp.]